MEQQINPMMVHPLEMQIFIFFLNEDCISRSNVECIVVAPQKQNKLNVLDWLRAYSFYGCSCLVFPCLPGHNEPAPTSAPWRMNDKWSRNNFLLGFSSLANHDGYFSCFFLSYLPINNPQEGC
jgi:hypothetical protein